MNDQMARIRTVLYEVIGKYPADQSAQELQDVDRLAFHINLVANLKGFGTRLCDLGGGTGAFSVGSAALGMRVTLVDDFRDPVNLQHGTARLGLHRSYGIDVVSRDLIQQGIDFPPASFDMVTTFDSMEHWHHSPRTLFRQVMECLAPGGAFLLGVPNGVNLRKRITLPFGIGKWSSMRDWYDQEVFRGHVREPDVDDLKYIVRDMGQIDCTVFGRNWQGYYGRSAVAWLTRFIDHPLRMFPSLCSDIYVLGRKPAQ